MIGSFKSEVRKSFVLVLTIFLFSCPAMAQDQGTPLRAAIAILPPLVLKDGDQLKGFSIDVWNEVAARMKVRTTYQVAPNVDTLFASLRTKSADVIATGIFYSSERDREFDYSYPIISAGLPVMVRDEDGAAGFTPLKQVSNLLFSKSAIIWLSVALLMIILPAHVIWLLDRGNDIDRESSGL